MIESSEVHVLIGKHKLQDVCRVTVSAVEGIHVEANLTGLSGTLFDSAILPQVHVTIGKVSFWAPIKDAIVIAEPGQLVQLHIFSHPQED